MSERRRVLEFLEKLHFHDYINHDLSKLEELVDTYYEGAIEGADESTGGDSTGYEMLHVVKDGKKVPNGKWKPVLREHLTREKFEELLKLGIIRKIKE